MPVYYPRQTPRPVSCYALFKWMAASKPTSWLSMGFDFVNSTKRLFGDLSWWSGFFSSRAWTLAPMPSLPNFNWCAFGVYQDLIGGETLASCQSLYLTSVISEAAPKCISGSTSYLQVWLAFHPYPHLIGKFFNIHPFGPPFRVTGTSPWTWVDHLVSRLLLLTSSWAYTIRPDIAPCSDSLSLRLHDLIT